MREDDFVHAVHAVACGGAVISPKMTRRLIERFEIFPPRDRVHYARALGSLSNRELDVLSAVSDGETNQQIARELHVASTTIKTHVSNVLAKLGVGTRIEAALMAREAGLSPAVERQGR